MPAFQHFDYGTGYVPDLYDYRDKVFEPFGFSAPAPPPALPDVSAQLDADFPIYDQGQANACVGFSYKEAAQIIVLQATGMRVSLSPGFVWYLARRLLGWATRNEGCYIRDAIKMGNSYGCPLESLDRWGVDRYAMLPSDDAFAQAHDHLLLDYARAETSLQARAALHAGHPVIFGTILTESFADTRKSGVFERPDGAVRGAHAMTAVKDDATKRFPSWGSDVVGGLLVRNHWTRFWGLDGWCWMPYVHFDSPAVSDAWVLRKAAA